MGRGVQPLLSLQTDVFIAMELMGTCAGKLKKRMQGPIPGWILGKMTVAVRGLEGTSGQAGATPASASTSPISALPCLHCRL